MEVVSEHFGHKAENWRAGRRVDNASRALAAYLARRRLGCSARQAAVALGYRGHGGVCSAVARIESSALAFRRTVGELVRRLH